MKRLLASVLVVVAAACDSSTTDPTANGDDVTPGPAANGEADGQGTSQAPGPSAAPAAKPSAAPASKPSAAIYFVVEASNEATPVIGGSGSRLDYARKGIWRFSEEARDRNLALGLTLQPRRSFEDVKPCNTTGDCPSGAQCSAEVFFQECGNIACSDRYPAGRCPHSLTTCAAPLRGCSAVGSVPVCDPTPFCIPTVRCEGSAYSKPDVPIAIAEESASTILATMLAHYPGGADAFEGAYRGALANVERFATANPGVPAAIVVISSLAYFSSPCTTKDNVVALARSAFTSSRIRTFGADALGSGHWHSALRDVVEAGGGGSPWDASTPEKLAVALHEVAVALATPVP